MKLTHLLLIAFLLVLAPPPGQAQTLKIASLAPEGSVWMVEMRAAAEEIEQRSAGRVNFRFYGGGVQGNSNQIQRKIRIGQLHGATFTSGEIGAFSDVGELYGMPMVFNSFDEVSHVRAVMDERIRQQLEDDGHVNFGFSGAGFSYLMSNTPVASLEDMSRQKTWLQEGNEAAYGAFRALGISPISMPLTDVLTGLQTELLDSVSMSPMGAVVLQFHTKLKFITDSPLSYVYGALIIDQNHFSKLTAEDQALVREVMGRAYRKLDEESIADDREALQALLDAGLKLVPTASGEALRWREKVAESNRALAASGVVNRAMLEEMLQLLADYRAARAQ
jgi:TRAP-type C4-dicarboxylate transport system substrate-binding protein